MGKLTRQAVLEGALRLADEEGVEAVTIRRLAGELQVTPMALYWHFKNKTELLTAAVDHLMAGVIADVRPDRDWRERLRVIVEALVGTMRAHPSLPALLQVADKEQAESFTRATEATLDILAEAGFTLDEGYTIASYLLNGAVTLVHGRLDCRAGMTPEKVAQERRMHALRLQALPPDCFPRLVEYGRTLEEPSDAEEYFSFGVDLLIAGVEAMAAKRAREGTA